MPRREDVRLLPYSPEQLFDLVADVGSYPGFLPGVAAVRVRGDSGSVMFADLVASFGSFRERFTSRVEKDRPRRVRATLVDGPLSRLENDWRFEPAGDGSTELSFLVDFAFRSRVLNAAAERVFDRAFENMVAAFERRAAELYGASASGGISSSSAHSAA